MDTSNSTCMASSSESDKSLASTPTYSDYSSTAELRANETYGVVPTEYDRVYVNLADDQRDYPISNDLFEGKMRLLLREDPKNKYDFKGDHNVHWELQIQGRFKRAPGPLYLGVEIPEDEEHFRITWPMRTVSKAFCRLIKFMGYNLLHNSFGEKGDRPHFATPAFQAFDKFIASKPDQPPPVLGRYIHEPYESAMGRRKFQSDHTIDTTLLYTMSFNDTFFDPVQWQVTGVPLLRPVDMSRFTNNIRFAIWEVEEENHKPVASPKNGDLKAVAHGMHTKKNHVMWFQLHRQAAY